MQSEAFIPFAELFKAPLRNGLTKPKAVRGEGVKMVNMGEVFGHRRIHNLEMDRVPMGNKERESSLLLPGDLLFARQSLVLSGAGKCVLFQGDNEEVTFESHIIRCRLDQQKAEPSFYFYLFQSSHGRSLIESIVEQVAAAGIRGSDLGRLEVPLPPLAEQKAIAEMLGSLDDKIELNRRMNATLEAMARSLFQSWFVDFDPVRRNQESGGKPQDATDALFPATFQDSDLGPIPKEWRVAQVVEVASRIAMGPFGSRITRDNFVPDGVPVVRGGNLTNGFVDDNFVFLTDAKADDLKASVARPLDIVFTHRGTLGQVGIIPMSARYPRYVVSQSQMFLSVDRAKLSPWAAYLYFSSSQGEAALLANTSTTGVPAISRPTTSLKAIQLVVPPIAVANRFDEMVQPLFLQREQLSHQSRNLATLRDLLLSKLLSGEMSVEALTEHVS